jgi:hypothetical protein
MDDVMTMNRAPPMPRSVALAASDSPGPASSLPASTGIAADADRPPGQDLPANGEAKRSRSDAMKAFHRRTGKGTLMGNALVRRARRPT